MSSPRSRAQVVQFYGDTFYRRPDERQAAAKLEADTSHEPIVYYMRMDRLCKIGWTTNLRSRVESIGPQGVIAIEYGGRSVERERHKTFMDDHSHYEWFWLRDALTAHIIQVRATFEERSGLDTESWIALHGVRRSLPLEGETE